MAEFISVEDYITEFSGKSHLLIDVRSPGEFMHGHLPGAFNLPILNNEERTEVGTTYKKQGHEAAVQKGFDLVGSKFGEYIRQAKELSDTREAILYCWRGGMRSGIMGWLLMTAGFRITLIRGGYKSYRRWALKQLETDRKVIVLGGMTGSGKTDLLKELEKVGEQVIDLEGMANHKGSAFGGLGQPPQPTIEQFENELALKWASIDASHPVWIENESRSIGSVILPAHIYELIQAFPMIELVVGREERLKRVLSEYGKFSVEELKACTIKVEKRLGGLQLKNAIEFLASGNLQGWVDIMLDYYDKLYRYSQSLRKSTVLNPIAVRLEDINSDAVLLRDLAAKMLVATGMYE